MDDIHILVDPFVLAVPLDRNEAAAYLVELVAWLGVLRRNRPRCSVSEAAVAALWSCGRYPTKVSVEGIIAENGIKDVSAVDVINLLRPLSETEPFFEAHTGVRSMAARDWKFEPQGMFLRLGAELGATLRDAVVIGLYVQASGWAPDGLLVATRREGPAEGQAGAFVELVEKVDGTVTEIDAWHGGAFEITPEPASAEADLSLVDLYKEPVRAAIHFAEQCGERPLEAARLGVGPDFVSSIEAFNIQRQPAVLRALYRRVVQAASGQLEAVEGAALHAVRVNANANAEQVERGDGGRLWRCTVTMRGAGYRLHYWTIGNNIELQRVMQEGEA